MIFKTINSSVDETRKTLALFNKDWNTYKRNWQNANGVFGKIGSVFTPANAITKSDIEAIKAYNSQIDSCVTSQTAFNRTMLSASPAAQNLVASYNGGKVSAQGMATAQNAARESTIGLTIAQTALNTAIGMGIGLLISLVVKGIDKLVHANEEAIEKAEELRRKYEEFKSTNESNVTTLNGLKKEFEELSKGVSQYGDNVSLTTEQYERYKEIIQQIVGISPSLAEGYSTENGYIADKNGLLERAIELQEIEYRNELRKITNLQNLKTSMAGYIAEYKDAFEGGWATEDMSATITVKATDFSNALYKAFNYSERYNNGYSSEDLAREILKSLGIDNIDKEMEKFFSKNGYYQPNWFFDEYVDEIAKNIDAVTNDLSYENVGLEEDEFENRILNVKDCAQAYLDMKDSISMANESIQKDLQYIAEYADGYSNLTTEQQKFVNEFLKGFNIDDIVSRDWFGNLTYDEDKMKSVKRQITDFVEALSQDKTTKSALADLYAIPTDEQPISEFIEQFRNALEVIKAYCQENGIEIPIAITDSEQTINDLETQYQNSIDYAKNNFDGYDPTNFFKENSINTQEEIDAWQEIAQGAKDAAQAEKEYIQNSTLSKTFDQAWSDSFISENETIRELGNNLLALAEQGRLTIDTFNEADSTEYFKNLGISADEAVLKINKLVDESTQLSSMSGQISAIAGALGTKQTDGFVNADTLSSFDVEIRGLKSWDQFQAVLGSTASSYEECQKAANALASEWVRSNNFLAQLTEGNKAYYETQLKAMGVENASEVIYDALSAKEALVLQEQILAAETEAATNNTNFSIAAFLNEAGATEIARACLFQLITAEQVFNNTDLSTAEKIEKLKELANAYGQTAIVARIANMEKAEQDGHIPIDYEKELAALQTDINNAVGSVQIDFNSMGGAASHAADAGKSAAESYIEAFEEELSDLSQLRDNGVITEKEYLDSLRALYERYFANKLGYEKEYAKYQRQYLEGYKSLYESALSGISTLLGNQIDGYKDAKDAAISSLTQEKDARLEVIDAQKEQLEAQKDLIDEQIEAKQKLIDDIQNEIDAMKEANSERQRQLDLQKAQYELERMQHQRTILQYSEENGMQYVQNDEGLRTAKENVDNAKFEIEVSNKEKNISLLEDEISLLEEQKDAIQNQMDLLDKQAEQIESYYSKMISETEAYYDSLINNMERQKSKWEEIAEIESVARAYSDLEQVAGGMGYSVQDILSGNEQAFEDFKSRYIALLSDLNNNSSFSEGLSYATSGIAQDIDNLEASAATVSESTGKIAANIGEVNINAEALSSSLSNINDSLSGFSETDNITAAADAFSKLGQAIQSVADALNISEDGTIGSLTGALKSLCEIPLCQTDDDKNGGILSKFQALKTAVTDVTSAISGGGSSASDSGDGGNSSSPGTSSGAAGNSSGGLAGAIASLKSAATDALGGNGNDESEGQSEGSGIIAQFGQLKNTVTDTTEAIGSGDSKQKKKSKGNSKNGNLISSITSLGSTTSEILTGDGNDEDKSGGVIGRFEQFKDVIGEANEHVTGIATGLHDIDGETVECTIKVNVEQNGELPAYSKGVLAPMKLESGEYKAKYGRAFAKGSGNYKGLPKSEKNALRSEYGQPELTVYPDGTTELTTQPTISDLPKGTVIFNEAQTKEIFQNKADTMGSVSASGSTGQSIPGKPTLPPPQRPAFLVQQELQEECLAKTGSITDKILSPLNMLSRNWKDMSGLTGNINHINHNGQNQSVNVGGINITCPGVTSQEVARQLGTELNHIFSGFHNYADQQSRVR